MRPLKPLARTDEIDESIDGIELWDSANIFFSHSHRDYDKVMHIAKCLTNCGFAPWLAETHIDQGDYINEEIEEALGRADAFMLFLSTNALNSRWTGKEYGIAAGKMKIPIFVIADDDELILDVACRLANGEGADHYSEGSSGAASEFCESLKMHQHEANYFKLKQVDSALDSLALDSIVRPFKEQSNPLSEVLPKPG